MEAEWTSAEFHRPTLRPGMQNNNLSYSLCRAHVISQCTDRFHNGCLNAISPQVSVIKVKIHEATGMPAGKQKLQYEVNIYLYCPYRKIGFLIYDGINDC